VRISPQQRLMGQASNGDVVTVNFARDYKATLAAEENTTDGERKPRKAHKLLLTAATDDAAYGSPSSSGSTPSSAPIKARFLSESGRLLKTAFYRRFQRQLGAERPTETVIIDGLNPQPVTMVRLSDFSARNAARRLVPARPPATIPAGLRLSGLAAAGAPCCPTASMPSIRRRRAPTSAW
jgi:hypothetical protein